MSETTLPSDLDEVQSPDASEGSEPDGAPRIEPDEPFIERGEPFDESGESFIEPGEPLDESAVPEGEPAAPFAEPAFRAGGAAGALAWVRGLRDPIRRSLRTRGGRIGMWGLVVSLTISGIGLISYPFITQVWAQRIQSGLEEQFDKLAAGDEQALVTYRERKIRIGGALTRLIIPRLKVTTIVVEGTTGNALRAGAGHYRSTPLPGEPGNVAIAGHRTGFGQPFRHLERMRAGDEVILETPIGRYIYTVTGPVDGHPNPWITHSTDHSVLLPTAVPSLTLTTCDPPGTSKNRLIVRATLTKSIGVGG